MAPRRRKHAVPAPAPVRVRGQKVQVSVGGSPLEEMDLEFDDQPEPAEPPPDPEKVARLADEDMSWVQKPVVLEFLKDKAPDLVLNDRAPIWAVVTLDAYICCPTFLTGARSAVDVLDRVRQDLGLQQAVTGAYRMNVAAFEIMELVLSWKVKTENPNDE